MKPTTTKALAGLLLLASLGMNALLAQPPAGAPGAKPDPAAAPPSAAPAAAPAANPAAAPAASQVGILPGVAKALKNRSKEEQQRFSLLVSEASQLLHANESQRALDRLSEAGKIEPDYFDLHALTGAAFAKLRDFDKAAVAFERALALNPAAEDAKFNLAEIDFVRKKYKEALEAFEKILASNTKIPESSRTLILYKKYLCLLLTDRGAEADALLKTFRFESDTPEYYYANAAKSFRAGNEEDARGWLRSAANIYRVELLSLFIDSLYEIGWVKEQKEEK